MKWKMNPLGCLLAVMCATVCVQAVASPSTTDDSRYGLFNGLDHRSAYGQGVFPEPFLVDDSDLETGEARLDWAHTDGSPGQHGDTVKTELEQGFGLLTVEVETTFERNAETGGDTEQGVGNVDVGARYPFLQFVSDHSVVDTTVGAALEVGIPVNSVVSKNWEWVPKLFDDLRLGSHFTLQSILGYSMVFGGGDEGGLRAFEYGFDFGWAIQHSELPLPGLQQLIPMCELKGETTLNKESSGESSLIGTVGFRANLAAIGQVQPRLGFGYIFPGNDNARAEVHRGIVTSLVFQY